MNRTVKLFALPIAIASGLTGCTMGPEPERPTTAADVGESYVYATEAAAAELPDVSPWWRTFGDEATIELVELALANNTDLRAAAARVLEAEAGLEKAGGARLPQIGYGLSASKQRNSFVLPEIGRRDIESTTYSYNFNVSWQADLFGRLEANPTVAVGVVACGGGGTGGRGPRCRGCGSPGTGNGGDRGLGSRYQQGDHPELGGDHPHRRAPLSGRGRRSGRTRSCAREFGLGPGLGGNHPGPDGAGPACPRCPRRTAAGQRRDVAG